MIGMQPVSGAEAIPPGDADLRHARSFNGSARKPCSFPPVIATRMRVAK
jgi:hypothetical protein